MVLPLGCTMCVGSEVMCRVKRGSLWSGGNSMDMPENKIHLLSKCVERRFAEKLFYEGILHFGYPGEWKRYTDLTYKLEGIVRPLVGKEGMKED